jgi:hypothetical protein
LQPARRGHGQSLEFLRPDHGHKQVDEQHQGNNAHDEIFHRFRLQFFAEADVKAADDKEHHHHRDKDQIIHRRSPPGPEIAGWRRLNARENSDTVFSQPHSLTTTARVVIK